MKILFDTNVILDVSLRRVPFVKHSAALVGLVEAGNVNGLLCATTLTTIDYLMKRASRSGQARGVIDTLLRMFEIAPVNRVVLEAAASGPVADFEDAVIVESARHAGATGIVTRDMAGFRASDLPVYSPAELLETLSTR